MGSADLATPVRRPSRCCADPSPAAEPPAGGRSPLDRCVDDRDGAGIKHQGAHAALSPDLRAIRVRPRRGRAPPRSTRQAGLPRRPGTLPAGQPCSHHDQPDRIVQRAQIIGIAGHNRLASAPSAQHDMGVDDIRGGTDCQETTDTGRIEPVKGHDVCGRDSQEASKSDLSGGAPDRLRQGTRRRRHTSPCLRRPGQQDDNPTIIAIQCDEPSRVERDARAHAASIGVLPAPSRMPSAQARSASESSPPVALNASASMSAHPATSSRAMATACCTKPEMLGDCPDATSRRMASTCSRGSVTVIFWVLAIPTTILWVSLEARVTRRGPRIVGSRAALPTRPSPEAADRAQVVVGCVTAVRRFLLAHAGNCWFSSAAR